jgi:hypothetical protein
MESANRQIKLLKADKDTLTADFTVNKHVPIQSAHALKVLCDLYIQKKAQQFVNQRRKAVNSRS